MTGLDARFCAETHTTGHTVWVCIKATGHDGHRSHGHYYVAQERALLEPEPLVTRDRTRPYFPLVR